MDYRWGTFQLMGELAGILALMIPLGLVVVVPIVAIVLGHQRKIAELKYNSKQSDAELGQRITNLEMEVQVLRDQLHTNILKFEDRPTTVRQEDIPPPFHQDLTQ